MDPIEQARQLELSNVIDVPKQALFDLFAITHQEGYCFCAELPEWALGDTGDRPDRSRAQLFENGRPLGPGHSSHADIRAFGRGRYSHWSNIVLFSASDNSDPCNNGRRYAIVVGSYQQIFNKRQIIFELTAFNPERGFCFTVPEPNLGGDTTAGAPHRSSIRLFEDGVPLGPCSSSHLDIQKKGQGRYSQWKNVLYLSSTDNSDPRTNGRTYLALYSKRSDPVATQMLFELTVFNPEQRFRFTTPAPISDVGDSLSEPYRSSVRLFEDGVPLGPNHASHLDIQNKGQGRYSHWHDILHISATDNSDPRTNGRTYIAVFGEGISGTVSPTHASEDIRRLPPGYGLEEAYNAVEACLRSLVPSAVLGDPYKAYWLDLGFVRDFRKVCGDDRRTMERKYTVYQLIKSLDWASGDIAECGTYRGATAYFMALAVRETRRERQLHLFDSFEGLSSPTEIDGEHWEAGVLAASVPEVQDTLADFDYIRIHKGWIPTRFHEVADREFCFVHIDVDLFQPTFDSLDFFYSRLVPGGIILCDDYGSTLCPGARKAMDDFFATKPERVIDLPTEQGFIIKRP